MLKAPATAVRIVLLLSYVTVAGGQAVTPDSRILRYRDPTVGDVLWVSGHAARNADGTPDLALLRGRVRALFSPGEPTSETGAATGDSGGFVPPPPEPGTAVHRFDWTPDHPADCQSSFSRDYLGAGTPSSRSLAEMARNSRGIVRGTIERIDGGFLRGVLPWSLLTVRVDAILKAPSGFSIGHELLVAHPHARFTFAGRRFCNDDPFFRHAPAIADEVLIFVMIAPPDEEGLLVVAEQPETIMYQPRGGPLVVDLPVSKYARAPFAESLENACSLDDIVRIIRRIERAQPSSDQPHSASQRGEG